MDLEPKIEIRVEELMVPEPTKENIEVLFKTLRKILNKAKANHQYTQGDIDQIMSMARKALLDVTVGEKK